MEISLYLVGKLFIRKALFQGIAFFRLSISWLHRALEVEIIKLGFFAQPGGNGKRIKAKKGQKQQQISPLRRQSTPPSVEMTGFGWGREKTRNGNSNSRFLHYGGKMRRLRSNDGVWVGARKNTQRQQQQQISPLRRQSTPPSVEMTGFWWGREKTRNGNSNSRFLHYGGADFSITAAKCTAFGRNDDFWVAGPCSTRTRSATIVRYGCSLSWIFGASDWAGLDGAVRRFRVGSEWNSSGFAGGVGDGGNEAG